MQLLPEKLHQKYYFGTLVLLIWFSRFEIIKVQYNGINIITVLTLLIHLCNLKVRTRMQSSSLPLFPTDDVSIPKSSRPLHSIPPSYIILLNQITVFLALLVQNRPSTVCQELAAAVANSAGSSLAHSLGWHGSSVLSKWRPCCCRLDVRWLASSLWTAVREGSFKLGDEAVVGYQGAGSAEGKASCLSGAEPELENNLHMFSSVGLKIQLNLWDGWRRHSYRRDIFKDFYLTIQKQCVWYEIKRFGLRGVIWEHLSQSVLKDF